MDYHIIPKIVLVGYGRNQIFMHECFGCGKRFIPDSDSHVFCDDCHFDEDKIPIQNRSKNIKLKGVVVKWYIEVSEIKKRSYMNYKKVYKRDEYTCQYCGYSPAYFDEKFIPLSIDHIHPFIYKGTNKMTNLVVACSECNGIAGSKMFDDFLDKKAYVLEKRKEKGLKTYFKQKFELKDDLKLYNAIRNNTIMSETIICYGKPTQHN